MIPRRLREKKRGPRAYVIELADDYPITLEAYDFMQRGWARLLGVRPRNIVISNVPVKVTTIRA